MSPSQFRSGGWSHSGRSLASRSSKAEKSPLRLTALRPWYPPSSAFETCTRAFHVPTLAETIVFRLMLVGYAVRLALHPLCLHGLADNRCRERCALARR